jgi:hypothetical protein
MKPLHDMPEGEGSGSGRNGDGSRRKERGPYADVNKVILDLAAKYGLRTKRFADGEIVLLCRQVRKVRGRWFIVSLTKATWGYYHRGRPSPRADIKVIKKGAPGIEDWSPVNKYPGPGRKPASEYDELYFRCSKDEALDLILHGPKVVQGQRLRPGAAGHVPGGHVDPPDPQLDRGGLSPGTPDRPVDGPEVPPGSPKGSQTPGTGEDPSAPDKPGRRAP